jgi:Holliday junction resolvasome RuvABC endonuclease subunit
MKTKAPAMTLGIDPGARQIGVSVFRDKELIFYSVKTFKKQTGEEKLIKLRKIIEKLIADYRIESVALEKVVFVQQHRSFVKIVYDEIRDFLKENNVSFFEYNPKLIRAILCGVEKPTKRNVALLLAQRYGELVRYFNVPRLWQKRYYAQLFDAIAVGLVCAKERREAELFPSKSDCSIRDV